MGAVIAPAKMTSKKPTATPLPCAYERCRQYDPLSTGFANVSSNVGVGGTTRQGGTAERRNLVKRLPNGRLGRREVKVTAQHRVSPNSRVPLGSRWSEISISPPVPFS